MSYQHQRVNSIKSRVIKHAIKAQFCGFCKNLGKSKSECAHSIKFCSILKNTECRYCHELGHTKNRCPKLEAKNKANRQRSFKRPMSTPLTRQYDNGWNVVSKRMKNQDTVQYVRKKQKIVNKFALLEEEEEEEEEEDRDFNGPKVVKVTIELKGAWAKSLSSSKPLAKPVVVEKEQETVKDMVKDMTHLLAPKYIGAWADAVSDSEDEEEDEEEITMDSYGRPSTDNSAW